MKRNILRALPAFLLAALFCVAAAAEGVTTGGFTIDLTPVLQAVIGLLAALITAKVIPWIKSKTTAQQQETLQLVASVLVYAAEQIYGPGNGKEKLEYVAGKLKEKGFAVDIDQIEAAVRMMNEKPDTLVLEAATDMLHPPDGS